MWSGINTDELDSVCSKIQIWILILAISKWSGVGVKTDSGNLEEPQSYDSAQDYEIVI